MTKSTINRHGFLVTLTTPEGRRTYAATDLDGLDALLIEHKGRSHSTYHWPEGQSGFEGPGVVVAEGLHIYSGGGSA